MSAVKTRPPDPPVYDRSGGGGDDSCPWAPRHLPVVLVGWSWRRPWRRRYFVVRCWAFCDLEIGPFPTWAMADLERKLLEES